MTRTTGATDAQIEAAAERWHDYLLYQNSTTRWDEQSVDIQSYWCAAMNKMAMALVTTEERIVRVDDLRALVQSVDRGRMPWSVTEAIDRIQAAIGEAE